jgi:hypothetical protein
MRGENFWKSFPLALPFQNFLGLRRLEALTGKEGLDGGAGVARGRGSRTCDESCRKNRMFFLWTLAFCSFGIISILILTAAARHRLCNALSAAVLFIRFRLPFQAAERQKVLEGPGNLFQKVPWPPEAYDNDARNMQVA